MEISETIKKSFIGMFKTEVLTQLNHQDIKDSEESIAFVKKTLKDKVYLHGELFYSICIKFEFNINLMCQKTFTSLKTTYVKPSLVASSKLQELLYPIMLQQKDFKTATGISKSRISRLLGEKKKEDKVKKEDLQAHEIYVIAKIIGLDPSTLFNYFYGDGERPILSLVPDNKEKNESEGEEE